MGGTFQDTAPSAKPPEDRLDSWKEIAAYLNRDVTTVQRWEKREGMPVHRHLHDKLGSVYAWRAELDTWARGRNLPAAQENGDDASSPSPSAISARSAILASRTKWTFLLPLAAGIVALAIGVIFVRPTLEMPALTRFVDGNGPVFAGKIFPFCFITIACGAISGFHALISSGTTPKMILRESHARMIGYGAMLMESFVGVMAMIAACALQPGVYFAINSPAGIVGKTTDAAAATIRSWGYALDPQTMSALAQRVGEHTLLDRTGGAPSLAVGMAQIFSGTIGGERLLSIWYHFAIMFEALFILTVLDAGTRVGRFMVQELGGHVWKPLGKSGSTVGILATSALMVGAWGYFLWQGVQDPLGGINSLWPLFGIANQLLACVALVVATTILLKMARRRWIWVTLGPMVWLVAITMTASYQKIFSANVRIGFLSQANALAAQISSGAIPGDKIAVTQRLIFNNRLDAAVTAVLAVMILVLLVEAIGEWIAILSGRKAAVLHESPFVATKWAEGGD